MQRRMRLRMLLQSPGLAVCRFPAFPKTKLQIRSWTRCCNAGPQAKGHADTFVQVAESFNKHVLELYAGTDMPRSDSTFTG